MLTFLINLDQRPDRLAFMQAQLGPMGLAFQRMTAVDGLGAADIGYPTDHPCLSKGEFACYLSHVNCWQALLDSGAERCLILEDDVIFAPDVKACLDHEAFFEHDGCITRLECRPFRTEVSKNSRHRFNGTRLRQNMGFDFGAGAYVITKHYAAFMLNHHTIPERPVDIQILDPATTLYRPHIIYQLDPAPATQRQYLKPDSPQYNAESDLQAERRIPKKPAKPRGIAAFFKARAKNAHRNIYHVTKVVPFSGKK